MTPRARVLAALRGQPTDQIPIFPVVTRNLGARALGRRVGECVLDPALAFDGIRAMQARFGFDGMECGLGPSRDAAGSRRARRDEDDYLLNDAGEPWARFQEDDDPVPLPAAPLLQHKAALDDIPITPAAAYVASGQLEAVRRLRTEMGEALFIAGTPASQTMNSLAAWRGGEQALLDLTDDPAFVHAAMDRATAISIELGRAYVDAGVDGLYIGDAWASASIISPRQFATFCLPRYARAVAAFHALGVPVYLHICGNATPLLEMMADTGVDAIEPLDPLGGVRVDDAVRRVGGRVSLKGGVNTLTLLNGAPDAVRAETRQVLEAAVGKCRGFLLGSGDDIPRDTPFENLDAMIETARAFV